MSAPLPARRICDCERDPSPSVVLDRRAFLRTTATGLAAVATATGLRPPSVLAEAPKSAAGPTPSDASETLAAQLFRSLDPEQRGALCFDFDHPLREKVDNNWLITPKPIRESLHPDQQDLVRQIFRSLHAPEFADRAMEQMIHDSEGKGFEGGTSVALFGQPGSGRFEFVITGRHCTRRCDGDSVAGTAFGGPIFYGHQAGTHDTEPAEHPGNVFWYQAKRANEVFQALDGRQRKIALVDGRGRSERATETVKLAERGAGLPGIPVAELSRDQRELVRRVMGDLLAPFRPPDANEALKLVEAQGLEKLSLAYFRQPDLGDDGVWDVWQLEGPGMLWYFRGAPHVHCWVHIRQPAGAA